MTAPVPVVEADGLVAVTQADIDAAKQAAEVLEIEWAETNGYLAQLLRQAFASHRIASTEKLAGLLTELRDWTNRHANGLGWRFADQEIAKKVDAALSEVSAS